jgi:outer membrane lipoprotein-sorting protein
MMRQWRWVLPAPCLGLPAICLGLLAICLGLLAGGVLCARGQGPAQDPAPFVSVPLLLQRIEAKAKTLKSLSGRFRQTKFTRLLTSPMESEGVFYWQPPDRFRWEVTHPAPFSLVARGDTVLVYSRDLKRATVYRHPAGDGLLGQIIGTAGDTEAFKNTYYMQITPTTEAEDRDGLQLQLEPRSYRQARYLKRVEVLVDPVSWLPQKVTITEANGDWSRIHLLEPAENAALADDLFSVQPPAGIQTQKLQGNRQP